MIDLAYWVEMLARARDWDELYQVGWGMESALRARGGGSAAVLLGHLATPAPDESARPPKRINPIQSRSPGVICHALQLGL